MICSTIGLSICWKEVDRCLSVLMTSYVMEDKRNGERVKRVFDLEKNILIWRDCLAWRVVVTIAVQLNLLAKTVVVKIYRKRGWKG